MQHIALIAEDDDLTRAMLKHALEEQGYWVFEARNGQECLQQYERQRPDIIFLDGIMPIMDGYACCEALRKNLDAAHMPIVMISNQDGTASIEQAFDLGATDYILKPIQWNFFFQRIRQLIKQAELLQQLTEQNADYQKTIVANDLTQVLTRRVFDPLLEREWQRGRREAQPLSLILADIDCFKGYGDTSGTAAADRQLQQVAQVIRSAVYRSSDFVCRYDDEGFAILLPNTLVAGAIYVATRIQNALKDTFQDRGGSMANQPITLSYGLSSLVPVQKIAPTQLLEAADTALHIAKSRGTNHVEVHFLEGVGALLDAEWLQPFPNEPLN